MARKKIEGVEGEEEQVFVETRQHVDESSREELLWLYDELKRLGVRSISDLENLIARTA